MIPDTDTCADLQADCLLLIFTLAALAPDDMGNMLANCYKVSLIAAILPISFGGQSCAHRRTSKQQGPEVSQHGFKSRSTSDESHNFKSFLMLILVQASESLSLVGILTSCFTNVIDVNDNTENQCQLL